MDWNLAIEKEREVLKRIVALFLAFARIADKVCDRSRPVRSFLFWVLRLAETVALQVIIEARPTSRYAFHIQSQGDSRAEARRLARCFRAAARVVEKQIKILGRCQAPRDLDRHAGSSAPVGGNAVNYLLGSVLRSIAFTVALMRNASALWPFFERRELVVICRQPDNSA